MPDPALPAIPDPSRSSTEVRVELFGGVRVTVGLGAPVVLSGRMAAIVALLGARGVGPDLEVPRDAAAFRLWTDHDEDEARRALVTAVYRLRQGFPDGAPWLVADRGVLAMPGAWVDLVAFRTLAERPDPADWRAALDLVHGELLAYLADEWADEERAVVREREIALLARLVADREVADDVTEALGWARRWSTLDPFDEAASQAVMRLYARSGRPAAALDHFAALTERLANELDVPPDRATARLAERIRADLAAGATTEAPAGGQPLIGRDAERRRLLAVLDRAGAGQGGLAVILGEPGIGKTRLLTELEASAEWRGWRSAWGAGEQFGMAAPFAPFGEALRAAIPEARRMQLLRLVDPGRLRAVSGLLPGLVGADGLAPDDEAWTDGPGVEPLADAIGVVLHELGGLAPQLLLLDDVQWGDPLVWPLLDALRPALAGSRVVVVVSARAEVVREVEAARERLAAWDGDGVPVVSLRGLDTDGLAALSMAADGRTRTAAELEALAAASGGNPLLALALLDAGDDPTTLGALPEDARVDLDRLFERRLAALSPAAREALEAAAVAGRRVEYAVWAEITDGMDLPAPAAELETAGLVRVEDDAYVFRHDTLRSLVVWELAPERRTALNRAAFESRRRRAPDDALGLLFHAEQLGDREAIAAFAQRAGDEALRSLAFASAARHYTRALETLPPEARGERFAALLGRTRALEVLADRDAQRADVQELEDLAGHLDDRTAALDAAIQRASFHWSVGEYPACAAVVDRALASPTAASEPRRVVTLLTMRGRILREQGHTAEARTTLERARTLARRSGDRHGGAMAMELLAGLAWRVGDHRTAATEHAEAARLFEAAGDRRRAAYAQNSLGTALWSLGDYEGARRAHERSLATCRAMGDRRGEGDNLDNLGGVAWALADLEGAIELYSAALAIRRASRDPWGVTISLTNLADTYALLGDHAAAFLAYDEALDVDRTIGVQRNEANAWQGKGKAQLDAGLAADAVVSLRRAIELQVAIGDRDSLVDARAALARALVALGDQDGAEVAIAEALAGVAADDRPSLREWVHLAAWEVASAGDGRASSDAAARHLAAAASALDELLRGLPDHPARRRVRTRFPVHRAVEAARHDASTRVTVRLPRVSTPLGKAVAEDDLVPVTWTTVDPADALIEDPSARRQAVAARLVEEAAAHGAVPTDDDLAAALGVSRRTILRDAEAMAAAGRPLATRARAKRGDAGA